MTTDIKNLHLVEHVVGAVVDPEPILKAFGINLGEGTVSLNLRIEHNNFAELTVKRYITKAELEALYVALEESKPRNLDVLSIKDEGPQFQKETP
jgi:hypothetical protein